MEWLSQFFEKIFCVFPRLFLVDPDEAGVRVTLGKRVKALGPGWYVLWPLMQTAEKIKVTPQIVDLRGQTLVTKDDRTILVSGAIQYRVSNAQKAILQIFDYDKNIQTLALGVISRFVSDKTYDECRKVKNLEEEILKGVRDAAAGWGLKLMQCFITDLCETKSYCITGGEKIVPIQENLLQM